MDIIKGYIHEVRNEINYDAFSFNRKVTTMFTSEAFVCAINEKNIIDSVGIRCRMSTLDTNTNDEVAACLTEIGVIFSEVGTPKEDLDLLKIILSDCYIKSIEYITERVPKEIFKEKDFVLPNYIELGEHVLIKLINYGLYG